MAQLQNITGTNGTGGATTTTSAGHSACTPTQTGGAVGGTNATSDSNATRSTTDMNITVAPQAEEEEETNQQDPR